MKRVFVCSPLSPSGGLFSIEKNINLAKTLCHRATLAGVAPYAPHVFFTQFLDDLKPEERQMGMEGGQAFLLACDEVWVYDKAGVGKGMRLEMDLAARQGIPVLVNPEPFSTVDWRVFA